MKTPASSKMPNLSDAEIEAALHPDQDVILPSSGFADSVMTAIHREAAAPAPIPFPWLRALPGLAAAALLVTGLLTAFVFLIRAWLVLSANPRSPAGRPAAPSWLSQLSALLHASSAAALPNVFWLGTSLAIAFACLLLCRRLIAAR